MKRFIERLELKFVDGEDYEVGDIYSDKSIAIVHGNPVVLNNWKDCTIMCDDNYNTTMFLNELKQIAAFCCHMDYSLDNVYYDEDFKSVVFLYSAYKRNHMVQYRVCSSIKEDGTYNRVVTFLSNS